VYSNSGEAPHIASITFKGVRSEVMLHALEERGIYVSAGSACSSNKPAVSSTLKAIGLAPDRLESTLRFSFSYENTIEEVDYAVAAVQELLPVLRRYVRKK
jgi:cysteine desulfurase